MKSPVTSITDDQLAELIEECRQGAEEHGDMGYDYDNSLYDKIGDALEQMGDRLRAAESDAKRMGTAFSQIMAQVDGNIRPTVRDIINGMPDANYIYDYCDQIDRIAREAMERKA